MVEGYGRSIAAARGVIVVVTTIGRSLIDVPHHYQLLGAVAGARRRHHPVVGCAKERHGDCLP